MPNGTFSVADMRSFELNKKYDAVQCLFSSIGYLTQGDDVVRALECFARHVTEDGIVVVEPWLAPQDSRVGVLHSNQTLKAETSAGVEHIQEVHELALYTVDEMLQFFRRAGLRVSHDAQGISGRGLYVAKLDH
jgi:hypothetical protein